MLNSHVRVADDLSWGLGWGLEQGIENRESTRAFWHWGDQDIFKGFALMDTINRTGIVVLTNSANGVQGYEPIISKAVGRGHPAVAWVQEHS
jgi:hypothetical protein